VKRLTDTGIERESLESAIKEEVALVDYDPSWPDAFAAERARLMAAFPGTFLEIEHIGSTAVPGMRTKPIVDLMAGVRTMEEAIALNAPLCANRYTTPPGMNECMDDRQFFLRHARGKRTHHLHVVVHDSPGWHARLQFRDRLRADDQLRGRYMDLKADLANRFASDRESYTAGKSDFIARAAQKEGDPRK
jgi:GrpB-like predicted nucleotidyltransferase (UPF0157 family)